MRVLVVTAVPVERDAVTRAFGGGTGGSGSGTEVSGGDTEVLSLLPGAELHRTGAFDVLAGGVGPAAAAAATAFALAAAAAESA
ncbi:hypothetical protein AN221_02100, partial [Streptomyces nanshensis]